MLKADSKMFHDLCEEDLLWKEFIQEQERLNREEEIMKKLGIKSKETLRGQYLDPAIKHGLVNLTIPDKPTSKNQMYYKN